MFFFGPTGATVETSSTSAGRAVQGLLPFLVTMLLFNTNVNGGTLAAGLPVQIAWVSTLVWGAVFIHSCAHMSVFTDHVYGDVLP